MMRRRRSKLIFDTETYGLKPENTVFDIGYMIFNSEFGLVRRNYLVLETFKVDKLKGLPFYGEGRVNKYLSLNLEVLPWLDIMLRLWGHMKEYNVEEVIAYNLPFDLDALSHTNNLLRGKEFKMFDGIKKTDLYTVFCNFVKDRKDFPRYCEEHGFISEAGNLRTNAEVAYGFLVQNPDHVESHTAMSDVVEEYQIYAEIKKRKKRYQMEAEPMPWQMVSHNRENMKGRRRG